MFAPYLFVCGVLLLGSVLVRALPAARRSFDEDYEDGWDLTPRELAYLRQGPYGVVLTVLADLHGEGAVDVGRQRTRTRSTVRAGGGSTWLSRGGVVHRLDPPHDCDDRLAIAVYSGLNWLRHPVLLAALPRVRRACVPLRDDLRERALLPPLRRRIFATALLVYAVGLAAATVLEQHARWSTVVGAAVVGVVAVLLAIAGPRRTLAGRHELVLHRAALARVARDHHHEAAYLSDLVAAYGIAAVRVLCPAYVPAGALAPPRPSYEPRPVAEPRSAEPTAASRPEPVPSVAMVRVLPVRPARLAPVDAPVRLPVAA